MNVGAIGKIKVKAHNAAKKAKTETVCVFEDDNKLEDKPINGIYYCICGKKYCNCNADASLFFAVLVSFGPASIPFIPLFVPYKGAP